MMSDTIAAVSTPQGEGGIGIVRISGDGARAVADRIFRAKNNIPLEKAEGYSARLGKVYAGEKELDDAIALCFASPKSYTGEDVIELSVHGGDYIVRAVLRAALDAGARRAEPGEFTRRAYENGKIDLSQAESVMALIKAGGEQELALARAGADGRIAKEISKIKSLLLETLAGVAALCDYPDDPPEEASPERILSALEAARDRLSAMLSDFDAGKIVREGIKTAIIGAPNVGKSTLMNLLSGEERSIVTPQAGTTRDIIEDTVRLGGVALTLADTAGIRLSDDNIERIGVDRARRKAETAQLIFAVFDGSRPLCDDDKEIIAAADGKKAVAVINKSDLPARLDRSALPDIPTVYISAATGDGYDDLARAVAEISGTARLNPNGAVLFTERQRSCAFRAHKALCEALEAFYSGFTLDAVGVCADEALESLLELTGERVTSAVADEVFSRFCVGK